MLTATQQHAVDQFAKSISALGDDALIDTYHQAWEDHREASAEGIVKRPFGGRRSMPDPGQNSTSCSARYLWAS